jgi:hypothetical protein
MDMYCQKCGEPWEVCGLWDFEQDDYTGARQDFLNGIGCPACSWGAKAPNEKPRISILAGYMRDMLGDDIDGIASELDDLMYQTGGNPDLMFEE